ncbi:helix-turn-helix domain-containing protein [Sansalvadorimonas verongulae]|uniref:helix-turn-helix domain-containing protein n=1 Tax=Sansalvadorimonas verongulae TaxID=2172824 RepID=UPI0012BC08BE|nr:helix-turn-helix domain-containing protein [Sansalvadorimonas verongulae]MTI15124.1 DNA-binding protein [Sansalvadorimonas verongulae]
MDSQSKEQKLYTTDELSDRWKMSAVTLKTWRTQGLGPEYLKITGRILYREQDILRYEETRLRQGTSLPPRKN